MCLPSFASDIFLFLSNCSHPFLVHEARLDSSLFPACVAFLLFTKLTPFFFLFFLKTLMSRDEPLLPFNSFRLKSHFIFIFIRAHCLVHCSFPLRLCSHFLPLSLSVRGFLPFSLLFFFFESHAKRLSTPFFHRALGGTIFSPPSELKTSPPPDCPYISSFFPSGVEFFPPFFAFLRVYGGLRLSVLYFDSLPPQG